MTIVYVLTYGSDDYETGILLGVYDSREKAEFMLKRTHADRIEEHELNKDYDRAMLGEIPFQVTYVGNSTDAYIFTSWFNSDFRDGAIRHMPLSERRALFDGATCGVLYISVYACNREEAEVLTRELRAQWIAKNGEP